MVKRKKHVGHRNDDVVVACEQPQDTNPLLPPL